MPGHAESRKQSMAGTAAFAGLMAINLLFGLRIQAQQQLPAEEPLRFEVSSVKISNDGRGVSSGGILPGNERFTVANTSLGGLIMTAYGVSPLQITGPSSVLAEKYDIEAKAEHPSSQEQMMRMLQSLLADRLKLSLRREIRRLPIYELVAGRGGPKLQRSDDKTGGIVSDKGSGRGHLAVRNVTMPVFASYLTSIVRDRIVVDKTGLSGRYNLELTFSPSELTGPGSSSEARNSAAQSLEAPSIFTALREQLGLRLEAKKGPVEFLVVDHVERPAAN